MNNEMLQKTQEYCQKINDVANSIFYTFYFDEEEQVELGLSVEEYKQETIKKENLLNKSEKIIASLESVDQARAFLRFLNTQNPSIGLDFIDSL